MYCGVEFANPHKKKVFQWSPSLTAEQQIQKVPLVTTGLTKRTRIKTQNKPNQNHSSEKFSSTEVGRTVLFPLPLSRRYLWTVLCFLHTTFTLRSATCCTLASCSNGVSAPPASSSTSDQFFQRRNKPSEFAGVEPPSLIMPRPSSFLLAAPGDNVWSLAVPL